MKLKQIHFSLIVFFVCLLCPKVSASQTKFPIKIIFNHYSGFLRIDYGPGFEVLLPDTTILLETGLHFVFTQRDNFVEGGHNMGWINFSVDSTGSVFGLEPFDAANISIDRKSLSFNTVPIKIETDGFKGNNYYPGNYYDTKKAFNKDTVFYLLRFVKYSIDNGSFWDSANYYPAKKPYLPIYSRFYYSIETNNKLFIYNPHAASSHQNGVLKLTTVTFKACPCHLGDGYLIFPNKPKDTIRHWTNITLIAAIPTEIIIVDAKGNKEVNYFYPPRKGVLKRKDMLRKKK